MLRCDFQDPTRVILRCVQCRSKFDIPFDERFLPHMCERCKTIQYVPAASFIWNERIHRYGLEQVKVLSLEGRIEQLKEDLARAKNEVQKARQEIERIRASADEAILRAKKQAEEAQEEARIAKEEIARLSSKAPPAEAIGLYSTPEQTREAYQNMPLIHRVAVDTLVEKIFAQGFPGSADDARSWTMESIIEAKIEAEGSEYDSDDWHSYAEHVFTEHGARILRNALSRVYWHYRQQEKDEEEQVLHEAMEEIREHERTREIRDWLKVAAVSASIIFGMVSN